MGCECFFDRLIAQIAHPLQRGAFRLYPVSLELKVPSYSIELLCSLMRENVNAALHPTHTVRCAIRCLFTFRKASMPSAGSSWTGKHMMLPDKSTGQITVSIATAETAAGSECPVQCINKATVK